MRLKKSHHRNKGRILKATGGKIDYIERNKSKDEVRLLLRNYPSQAMVERRL